MEKKPGDKTIGVRTGKDILNLFKSKEREDRGIAIVKPRDEIETTLFNTWSELLGHENFGIHQDFFQVGPGFGFNICAQCNFLCRNNTDPENIFTKIPDLLIHTIDFINNAIDLL